MKFKSFIAMTAVMSQITAPFIQAAMAETQLSGADRVKAAIMSAKEAALVLNYSNEDAYKQLVNNIKDAHATTTDIISYVNQNASADERGVFNEALEKGAGKSPAAAASLLNSVGITNVKKASNFKVSCAAGLGIGIPLTLAGLIIGIVYLANRGQSNDIKTSYIDQRNTATHDYLAAKGKLDVALASANQQIAVDQTGIAEAQRKIDSGFYGEDDKQKFYAQIATFNTDIAAQQNIAGGTNAQQASLTAQYNNAMNTYSEREASEIQAKTDSNNALPYIAVPALIIGVPFLIAGASASDC